MGRGIAGILATSSVVCSSTMSWTPSNIDFNINTSSRCSITTIPSFTNIRATTISAPVQQQQQQQQQQPPLPLPLRPAVGLPTWKSWKNVQEMEGPGRLRLKTPRKSQPRTSTTGRFLLLGQETEAQAWEMSRKTSATMRMSKL
mmetsp:Transcript_5157/g.12295  ORF Transcript_5157/g.12295 Transcript_5157/m.12295 type:complete len:144 (+) Transcript_5157:75-506(+)